MMLRRQALKAIGASATSLVAFGGVSSVAAAEEEEGAQPLGGELPNTNVPEDEVVAFASQGQTLTRDTNTFLTLRNGWVGPNDDELRELLNNTRQTFTYDGQMFVLDEASDWSDDSDRTDRLSEYWFTHTDPPKQAGKVFDVTWDAIVTGEFYDPISDRTYEPGERFRPSIFPTSNTYEIVPEEESE